MDQGADRILYLAVADGRGHLMRAHLVRQLLHQRGVAVTIVTTSPSGRAFLDGLGTPSAVLAGGFAVGFDGRHRMQVGRTERALLGYLLRPQGLRADRAALQRMARGCALLVNDSLHPAGLALAGRLCVVDVCGANLWRAALHHFDDHHRWAAAIYRRLVGAAAARAFGRIAHGQGFDDGTASESTAARVFQLPPLTAPPRRSRQAVRRALGVGPGQRLAALYFNPHFRDASIAAHLEAALHTQGYVFRGISEPWAGRRGWSALDPAFSDVVAASDLLVSGGGAAALQQARAYQRPLLAILGVQPEQERNIAQAVAIAAGDAPLRAVAVGDWAALGPAIAALTPPGGRAPTLAAETALASEVSRIRSLWGDTLIHLITLATKEPMHDRLDLHQRPGSGDQQPARWSRHGSRRRTVAEPPFDPSGEANATVVRPRRSDRHAHRSGRGRANAA